MSNTFPTNIANVTVGDDSKSIELWNKRTPQWINVKDCLPEEHRFVLVAYHDDYLGMDIGMGLVHEGKLMLCDGLAGPGGITHWMPLPELPQE